MIGITRPLSSRSSLTRFWPMSAPDFTFLTDKSFEKKFNHERELRGLVNPILDILFYHFAEYVYI